MWKMNACLPANEQEQHHEDVLTECLAIFQDNKVKFLHQFITVRQKKNSQSSRLEWGIMSIEGEDSFIYRQGHLVCFFKDTSEIIFIDSLRKGKNN